VSVGLGVLVSVAVCVELGDGDCVGLAVRVEVGVALDAGVEDGVAVSATAALVETGAAGATTSTLI
jgi:hypothetical protein